MLQSMATQKAPVSTGVSFPSVKRFGREAAHFYPYAEAKNTWRYTFTPPTRIMTRCNLVFIQDKGGSRKPNFAAE